MKGAGMFFVYDMLIGNPDCVPALEENTKKYSWMNRVRVVYKNGKISAKSGHYNGYGKVLFKGLKDEVPVSDHHSNGDYPNDGYILLDKTYKMLKKHKSFGCLKDRNLFELLTKFYKKNVTSSIKAVTNLKGEILYMSRADIPSDARTEVRKLSKAYHVVSFRKPFLLKYSKMKPSPLEKIEYNEYLRILEHGYKIQGVFVDSDSISVDTPEDLDFVKKKMLKDPLYPIYKT